MNSARNPTRTRAHNKVNAFPIKPAVSVGDRTGLVCRYSNWRIIIIYYFYLFFFQWKSVPITIDDGPPPTFSKRSKIFFDRKYSNYVVTLLPSILERNPIMNAFYWRPEIASVGRFTTTLQTRTVSRSNRSEI